MFAMTSESTGESAGGISIEMEKVGGVSNSGDARAALLAAWEALNASLPDQAVTAFRTAVHNGASQLAGGDQEIELADIYIDAATGLSLCGSAHCEEAAQILQQAVELKTKRDGECNIECGRIYRQLSMIQSSSKSYSKAVASMRKAIDIFEALAVVGEAPDPDETAKLYSDLRGLLSQEDAQLNEGKKVMSNLAPHCVADEYDDDEK